ncbi:unnamed protein product [Linum trigynum]|uniref:Uncharacterized protein n=1 Tax=Linum trigynum TaxID=586398 RepID=A0AAV2D5F2_9ROSI
MMIPEVIAYLQDLTSGVACIMQAQVMQVQGLNDEAATISDNGLQHYQSLKDTTKPLIKKLKGLSCVIGEGNEDMDVLEESSACPNRCRYVLNADQARSFSSFRRIPVIRSELMGIGEFTALKMLVCVTKQRAPDAAGRKAGSWLVEGEPEFMCIIITCLNRRLSELDE